MRLVKWLILATAAYALVVMLAYGPAPAWAQDAAAGRLLALDKDMQPVGECPLKHTSVEVDIAGFIARVTLTQQFDNPFLEPIEAIYTFPLSERAAVDAMLMKIGDRTIKGVVKEREEARRIYEAAREAGKAASLLDQERPNIFTQSVANIMPGDSISITISYVEYLKYEEGEYAFSFPMVVGPRFIPGTPDSQKPVGPMIAPAPERGGTDEVPDAGRITPPVTPEGTRAGHDVSLAVRIDAGAPIQSIESDLHEVDIERPSDTTAIAQLTDKATIPNRDFVLHYAVASNTIVDAVLTHKAEKGGFFTLIMQPPARVAPDGIAPKEMIFVIDCSGSMRGFPIEKAKKTMRLCIEGMNPQDTFNLVSFSGGLGYAFPDAVPNTDKNRRKALDYLDKLEGSGGTQMMPAIHAALGGAPDPQRLRIVCFMTDGYIGNDMAILDAIQKNAGTARVFSFGIGNSVNRFLIEGMARTGRGHAEIVSLESGADAAAKRFHERIQSPILTDISVDFGGLPVEEVFPDPGAMPDLFAANPLVLKGRYAHAAEGVITVRGNTPHGLFERQVEVSLPADEPEHDVLAPLWARERVAWLMERDWLGAQQGKPDPDIKKAVTQLGIEFGLVTQYTSFVAVEEKIINENGKTKRVEVPVEMPDGVSYEGVFGHETDAVAFMGGAVMGRLAAGKAMAAPQAMQQQARGVAAVESLESRQFAPPQASKDEEAPAPELSSSSTDDKEAGKLHPALRGLAAKVVKGSYTEGRVRVRDGMVEVFITLEDDSEERLDELRALGVKIVSHARSSKRVLARVRVEDLERIADRPFVKRIEPPAY